MMGMYTYFTLQAEDPWCQLALITWTQWRGLSLTKLFPRNRSNSNQVSAGQVTKMAWPYHPTYALILQTREYTAVEMMEMYSVS